MRTMMTPVQVRRTMVSVRGGAVGRVAGMVSTMAGLVARYSRIPSCMPGPPLPRTLSSSSRYTEYWKCKCLYD